MTARTWLTSFTLDRLGDRRDLWVAAALFLIGSLYAFWGYASGSLTPLITMDDWWFDADGPRIFQNATSLWAPYNRHGLHPIWPLLFTVPCVTLNRVFGIDPVLSLWLVTSAWTGIWCVVLFATIRSCGLSRQHATATLALCFSMANFWFWAPMPESWVVGSISILLALATANSAWLRRDVAAVAVSALTLGTTLTNWSAALIAHFRTKPARSAARVTLLAVVAVLALVIVLQPFVRNGGYRFGDGPKEARFLLKDPDLIGRVAAFALHTAVAPAISISMAHGHPMMSVQRSRPGSRGMVSAAAVVAWIYLLAVGLTDLVRQVRGGSVLAQVLAGILASQFALHSIYGEETFLYAMHFSPLLGLVVGLHLPRSSRFFRGILAAAVVLMCLSNVGALAEAVARTQDHRRVGDVRLPAGRLAAAFETVEWSKAN